uniref:Arenin n=1 Tax=Dryophytes arenicolor TaxID=251751 RepID=A0A455MWG9_9NEOB|nr:arenin [Dryophytes arenicolor]
MKTSVVFLVVLAAGLFLLSEAADYRCELSRNYGKGSSSFTYYYYDKATKSCKTFRYRGSGGNGNRFKTLEDCEATCVTG